MSTSKKKWSKMGALVKRMDKTVTSKMRDRIKFRTENYSSMLEWVR